MSSDLDAKPNSKEIYPEMGPAAKTAAATPRVIPEFTTRPRTRIILTVKMLKSMDFDELMETAIRGAHATPRPAGQHFRKRESLKLRVAL